MIFKFCDCIFQRIPNTWLSVVLKSVRRTLSWSFNSIFDIIILDTFSLSFFICKCAWAGLLGRFNLRRLYYFQFIKNIWTRISTWSRPRVIWWKYPCSINSGEEHWRSNKDWWQTVSTILFSLVWASVRGHLVRGALWISLVEFFKWCQLSANQISLWKLPAN